VTRYRAIDSERRAPDSAPVDQPKGLAPAVLGLFSATSIALASTAPAFSLAATLGLLFQASGSGAPSVLLIAAVPVLCIAIAFRSLGARKPDCGASFAWARESFGASAGWLTGWVVILADVIVVASLAQVSGEYTIRLMTGRVPDPTSGLVTLAGLTWIALMTGIAYRGTRLSARLQVALLAAEVTVLILLAALALWSASASHVLSVSLSGLNPSAVPGLGAWRQGLLIAVFLYWGWDTAFSLAEETSDSRHVPGRAAIVSLFILVGIYTLVTVAALSSVQPTRFASAGAEWLPELGREVGGPGFASVLVFVILTSAVASVQTTILPTARTALSMAHARALPRAFARMHLRFHTPVIATLAMGSVSSVAYVCLNALGGGLLQDTVSTTGLLVGFYYAVTAFAALRSNARFRVRGDSFIARIGAPAVGGAIITFIFGAMAWSAAAPSYGTTSWVGLGSVFLIGVGLIALGVVLLPIARVAAPAYFARGRSGREDMHSPSPAAR
jgi:amino acid transporter